MQVHNSILLWSANNLFSKRPFQQNALRANSAKKTITAIEARSGFD